MIVAASAKRSVTLNLKATFSGEMIPADIKGWLLGRIFVPV
jgi:hypothetical protein